MKPRISLILPVYNTERFINRCLDSIINQTFRDIEIIIVNDATPDNAMDIVKKYSLSDTRFVIVNKTNNEGLMKARQTGYQIAQGDYIVFCDTDDFLDLKALEILYETIVSENADIVMSGYKYVEVEGKITEKIYSLPFGNDRLGVYRALLEDVIPHMLWGNIYKRELFTDYTYSCFMNQTNGEDFVLFYEIVNHVSKVALTNKSIYYYCQNSESSSQIRLSDDALRKWVFVDNHWFLYMRSLGIFLESVNIKILHRTYSKLLYGYNSKIIIEGLSSLNDLLSYQCLIKYLGFLRGIDMFLLCKYGVYKLFRCRKR